MEGARSEGLEVVKVQGRSPKPPAFILGLGENGYGVLRSLTREGVSARGFYSESREFGRLSKYCEAHRLPPCGDDEHVRLLVDWGRRARDKPVLFATSDSHAFMLAEHREELAAHFRFHWMAADSLRQIVDKARMSRICSQAGVLTPLTHVTRPDEDPANALAALSFPCLVKPNRSFDSPFPRGRKNFVARTPDQLLAFYHAHPELKGATVCQEIVEGGDENIFQCTVLIRRSGEPGAVFCARKLHQYPPGYGVMCFGRSEENAALPTHALRLLSFLGYRGLASLEFKYRPADGRYYFIEMNPRLPWYNSLFAAAKVNLPYLTYLDLTSEDQGAAAGVRQRDGVYWISFKENFGWLLRSRGRLRARLASWLLSLLRARSHAWLDWRDPRPLLRAMASVVLAGVRHFCSALPGLAGLRFARSREDSTTARAAKGK